MTTTSFKQEQIIEKLKSMPPEFVLTAQCASLCSLYISGSYISATIQQLISELSARHKGLLDVESALEHATQALEYGIQSGLFIKEINDKYTPTESGWLVGKDWDRKMRLGWKA